MARIRVLEREDLPGVSRLLRAHLPGAPADEAVLAATLLDESSSDLGVSSLVAEDAEGVVVGFIASELRPLRLDSDRIRAACCSNLVVAPESRAGATGALMLKRLLAGPQELTFSETAMALVTRIWTALGGHPDHARAYDWMLVLRPVRWLAGAVPLAARSAPELRQRIPIPVFPAQALGPRLAKRAFPALEDDVRGEDADASLLAEHMPAFSQGMRLHPDYDEPYLRGLLNRLDTEGVDIVHRLVRRAGRPIGWYAYRRRPGGTSVVLHISGRSRDLDAVVGELVAHAHAQGSVALTGRMEPHLHDPLKRRGAPLWYARGAVVHTRDPTIAAVLATEQSLLTRLEGEWHLA